MRASLGTLCGPGAGDGLLAYLGLLPPALLLTAYLCGIARERRPWPQERTAFFVLGTLLIAVALSPAMLDRAAFDTRAHMAQHLLLGMVAPLALVLGRPGTLFLRAVPVRLARETVAFLAHPIVRVLTHPFTAGLLSVGGLYVVYLTPVGATLSADPLGHAWLLTHFLVSGTLFAWSIAGPDPAPHRPSHGVRLVALFAAAGAHAVLAARLGAFPVGIGPYEAEAVSIMLYGGDAAEALLALMFFHSWHTSRRRRRRDA